MKILKISVFIVIILITAISLYIYLNRQAIFDYSIDKLIENTLPGYIVIDELDIDLQGQKITIENFRILGPEGYSNRLLMHAPSVYCFYKYKDKDDILKGLKVGDIHIIEPVLYIERSRKGVTNLQLMPEVIEKYKKPKPKKAQNAFLAFVSYLLGPVKRLKDTIELKPIFDIESGRLVFDDFYISEQGYKTSIDNIKGVLKLDLQKGFKAVDFVETQGDGSVNADRSQHVSWTTTYDPTMPDLTMSNKFHIVDVDFIHFQPYYEKFSPFIFKKGRASGELIFDFSDGNIGSTNEVRFSGLEFDPKKDHKFNEFWSTSQQDLYKYFSSAKGDVVFDFKIKGPVESPKFYLGSKTKRALTTMLVNKVADAIFKKDEQGTQDASAGSSAGENTDQQKSDVEKIIDIFKGL
jgi:hypothetical protein